MRVEQHFEKEKEIRHTSSRARIKNNVSRRIEAECACIVWVIRGWRGRGKGGASGRKDWRTSWTTGAVRPAFSTYSQLSGRPLLRYRRSHRRRGRMRADMLKAKDTRAHPRHTRGYTAAATLMYILMRGNEVCKRPTDTFALCNYLPIVCSVSRKENCHYIERAV